MQNQTPQENKRLHIVVSGRVQGVGYRYFTQDTAELYSITGWVRNCDNGNVELQAQGKKEILDTFCAELKKGPAEGYVSEMDIHEVTVVSGESSFRIRH